MEKKEIYFDNAATTQLRRQVIMEMQPYMEAFYGNPSSVYSIGRRSKMALSISREQIAKAIGAKPEEIIFTSGGTEADNLAVFGIARANRSKGNHIITSKIEHKAVLNPCEALLEEGFRITYLDVDKFGVVNIKQLEREICKDTILISIMHSNNEVGTFQPVDEVAALAASNGIYFHTDAVQSLGAISLDVNSPRVDLLTISSHKIYGPKGIGALYVRKGTNIKPLIHGGYQERGIRPGTENVCGIVGFGKAIELITNELDENIKYITSLREYALAKFNTVLPDSVLNGHPTNRLPGSLNISFKSVSGETVIMMLDSKGIFASTGSACASGSTDASHVLLALGFSTIEAQSAVRFSFGKYNTKDEIDIMIEELKKAISRLE
ncbi:MAG: cysteine desulfurase family protein [Eubacteriales bacterium]